MNKRLKKNERLRKRKEIQDIIRQRPLSGELFLIHLKRSCFPFSRMAVLVRRKVGCAVVRNKVKRRVREVFRRVKGQFQTSVEMVIRPKSPVREATFKEITEDLATLFYRQGLIRNKAELLAWVLDNEANTPNRDGTGAPQ